MMIDVSTLKPVQLSEVPLGRLVIYTDHQWSALALRIAATLPDGRPDQEALLVFACPSK